MFVRSKDTEYFTSYYMKHLEEDYQGWRKKESEEKQSLEKLEQTLEKDAAKEDLGVIRSNLTVMLSSYKKARDKSWRSWRLFSDKTRDQHIENLQIQIARLDARSIIPFLKLLDEEIKYAKSKNGKNYKRLLGDMKGAIARNLPFSLSKHVETYHKKLVNIFDYAREARRVIAKQNQDERNFIIDNYIGH